MLMEVIFLQIEEWTFWSGAKLAQYGRPAKRSPTPGPRTGAGPWVSWYRAARTERIINFRQMNSVLIHYLSLNTFILKNEQILSVASIQRSTLDADLGHLVRSRQIKATS